MVIHAGDGGCWSSNGQQWAVAVGDRPPRAMRSPATACARSQEKPASAPAPTRSTTGSSPTASRSCSAGGRRYAPGVIHNTEHVFSSAPAGAPAVPGWPPTNTRRPLAPGRRPPGRCSRGTNRDDPPSPGARGRLDFRGLCRPVGLRTSRARHPGSSSPPHWWRERQQRRQRGTNTRSGRPACRRWAAHRAGQVLVGGQTSRHLRLRVGKRGFIPPCGLEVSHGGPYIQPGEAPSLQAPRPDKENYE